MFLHKRMLADSVHQLCSSCCSLYLAAENKKNASILLMSVHVQICYEFVKGREIVANITHPAVISEFGVVKTVCHSCYSVLSLHGEPLHISTKSSLTRNS